MAWCIKGVNRSAPAAFAPDGGYMAAGTMPGAVDMHFNSSPNLDIFDLDFASDERQLKVAGSAPSSECFSRISWGKAPNDSEEYSLGLIAGGLVDGSIKLWNPKSLISSSTYALVDKLSSHRGPVRGLEFNFLSPNLLASGADEGDICIWDVSKQPEPSHLTPLKGSGSTTQSEISFLSWNSKAEHILASTSYNGTTLVWDLKKQKPVISLSDSFRRGSVLQWNPDVAIELIVASDEDSSPSLSLWDVRKTISPIKEFVGHTKGVIAMSWCPSDSTYLLSCAKDNRTICWDTVSGEIVAELPVGTNGNFDVHWYSKIPGVLSASSCDGKIGIYNIEGCGRYGLGEKTYFSAASSFKAPKWFNRKVGVSFGFGGKLVSFQSTKSHAGSSEVFVQNLVTEHGLVTQSSEIEVAIKNGDRSVLRLLCERKSQESQSDEEKETWGFLKVMFTEEGTTMSNLLSHLGFNRPAKERNTVNDEVTAEMNNLLGLDDSRISREGISGKEESVSATDNGEDFFNNLPSPRADTPSASNNKFISAYTVKETLQEMNGQMESSDPSFDDEVQSALVVGDYKGAVAQCISVNRLADALVIAHVGGNDLWECTRDQYLRTSRSPYLKVVSALVNNDLMSIANTRPVQSWKETLALFCTFAEADEWDQLCDILAARLVAANDTSAATLCYICAGNIDKVVEMWSKNLATEHAGKSYVDRVQDLMKKTIIFAVATGQKQFSASLCKLIEKYAEMLASQGLLTIAMDYLNLLGTEQLSTELVILRDRIASSTASEQETETTATYDNTPLQNEYAYSAHQPSYSVTDASQHYYAYAGSSQMQPFVPSSPYREHYQQPLADSFGRGYNTPPISQPVPQPNAQPARFVPSQPIPAPMPSYHLPPVNTQQPAAKFVPANPPMLKYLEQYQWPSSLGSQLYPWAGNPSYQGGPPGLGVYGATTSQIKPTTGQMIHAQVYTSALQSRGFIPVSSNPEVQRPGKSSLQPPVTPAAPPPTVQTVDTSNVPAQQKPVIATLTRLFIETSEALGGSANPAKKREIDDNSKKLGALFAKLNSGDISNNAAEKLVQLCQSLDNADFGSALQIQVLLTTSDWDECNLWLSTLKRMIKTRQNSR